MSSLKDKKIIITGANGGIGNEITKLLTKEQANLTLVSYDEDALQKSCDEIKSQNGKASYIKADFSSIEGIKEAAEIMSEMDDIYMIIHLAGMMNFNSIGLQTVEGYNSLFRHFLARFRRKSKCYSKSKEMLEYSVKLLILKRNGLLSILD